MEHKLHRTDRQLASAGAVLEFYRDTMVLPDGQVQTWDYVHHKKAAVPARCRCCLTDEFC